MKKLQIVVSVYKNIIDNKIMITYKFKLATVTLNSN